MAGENSPSSVYLPEKNAGLGILFGVTMVLAQENVANADAMLEVAFNKHGGIRYVQFSGSAFFLTSMKERPHVNGSNKVTTPVFASLNMLYDNDNKVFHANLSTYLNVQNVLVGVGENNRVGEAVIHIDKKDWYFYIGRPSDMFGVSIANLATAKTYFMIGTKIENLPPLPQEVRAIQGDIDMSLMRDDLASAGGRGFATGVHFKTGFDSENKLLPFYVAMHIGAGADVMIRNYGMTECVGRSGKIGIDGWFASGQAYVFLNGRVGIRIRRRDFDIVNLGLAAVLQAKLPNPTWLKGSLHGQYSVLGGLVKGKFNLMMVVGEECEIINRGNEVENIFVINSITPGDNAEASVFTAPQASFNTAIDTEFSMMDLNENINSYRIRLEEFSLTKDKTKLPVTTEWNERKDVASIKTKDILPSQSTLKVTVRIRWERKPANGVWEPIEQDGELFYETKESVFNTGEAPPFIPEENVAYSYPIKDQYNLHLGETNGAYVQLEWGQDYLFPVQTDNIEWRYVAQFKNPQGVILESPLQYISSTARAVFTLPDALEKKTIYTLALIRKPKSTEAIDANLRRTETQLQGGDGNEVTLTTNQLEGSITQDVEKSIYESVFRTSQFETFQEKWSSLGKGQDLFTVVQGNVLSLGKRYASTELFDEFELNGGKDYEALIQLTASAETNWFNGIIAPLLYNQYPVDKDITIEWRHTEALGLKPLKSVRMESELTPYKLESSQIRAGQAPAKRGNIAIGYYLSYYCYWDYNELVRKALAKHFDNPNQLSPSVSKLLSSTGYTDLLRGAYPVTLTYTLPGESQPKFRNNIILQH